jgi:hypothetical protein
MFDKSLRSGPRPRIRRAVRHVELERIHLGG